MSNNTQWGGQWTGHQNTVSKKESAGNGHLNNWSRQSQVVWGGHHTGQHASDSYNGQNGQIASGSSSVAYGQNGQVYTTGQGWVNGQSTGHSGHGQSATPGYMNRPPSNAKHKKKVDWDKQVDQVIMEELDKMVQG
eukprot:TRINITY_DN13735_c0_g1_i1.p1 TRINITY_DN13735_c0_g1~~TRINITY_DN13735_c0_g1_i1.p1  ORF type:complete len:136 (-),score=36.53 TRINITY_DN13735_c0_g1_i1:130-537(-)